MGQPGCAYLLLLPRVSKYLRRGVNCAMAYHNEPHRELCLHACQQLLNGPHTSIRQRHARATRQRDGEGRDGAAPRRTRRQLLLLLLW
jgi:hypothetical protein